MRRLLILSLALSSAYACELVTSNAASNDWWKNLAIYQIYPRSFKDSNGDGIGDLNGITSKLEHLVEAGMDAVWLSPIYVSPMDDFGYDIANFTNVDPSYGTLADFDSLVAKAKQLNLRVLLDFVPNHSSNLHPWFTKSAAREDPYTDYYIWKDGKTNPDGDTPLPPNNWICTFGGPAWTWNAQRGQYYLHQFAIGQPDLNYRSEALQKEMTDVLLFWLERGVDGFRIDALNTLVEDINYPDEELTNNPNAQPDESGSMTHKYMTDQPETYVVLQSWRDAVDKFASESGTDAKLLISEAYTALNMTMKYYQYGSIPFNFWFITDVNRDSSAAQIKEIVDRWLTNMPQEQVANWVVGNHDQHRVATRYGVERSDQMSIVCMMLPGISVTYNGDEIGMVDTQITWEQSLDPAACYTDPDRYEQFSRDPERSPYQWDATTSAGFSTNPTTWLPVNQNYATLNLASQKTQTHTHFHVFQDMTALRKTPVLQTGDTRVQELAGNVLAVLREVKGAPPIVALVNCGTTAQVVDARTNLGVPEQMTVYTSGVSSGIIPGTSLSTSSLNLPGSATLVLTTQEAYNIVKGTQSA